MRNKAYEHVIEVNSNEQTVNNSGGPEKGRCVRGEPRIFQSGSPQALAGLACHLSSDKGIRQFCYYQGYLASWSCLFSRGFQMLLYRPRIRFYYTIFYCGNRVDLENRHKYNRLRKTAICQPKVADAILFGIYFIRSNIVICFILVLSVRVVFTLVTDLFLWFVMNLLRLNCLFGNYEYGMVCYFAFCLVFNYKAFM